MEEAELGADGDELAAGHAPAPLGRGGGERPVRAQEEDRGGDVRVHACGILRTGRAHAAAAVRAGP